MSVNKAIIIGNLGSDPDVRTTDSGTRVATLSVATNRTWTDDKGNEHDETEWHRLIMWAGRADVADQYMSKGDRIYAEGRIEYRQWEGDDGRTRYTTEIVVRDFEMLGGSSGGRSGPPPREEQREAPSRDEKQKKGAAESDEEWESGELGDFSDDALMGDDDLPF